LRRGAIFPAHDLTTALHHLGHRKAASARQPVMSADRKFEEPLPRSLLRGPGLMVRPNPASPDPAGWTRPPETA